MKDAVHYSDKNDKKKIILYKPILFFLVIINFAIFTNVYALVPNEILVIANSNVSGSTDLAKYYMKKRGIPDDNLLVLNVTKKEQCGRFEYEKKVSTPVQKYLKSKNQIKCLVTMFGMPLKIASLKLTRDEKKEKSNLYKIKKEIKIKLLKSKSDDEKKKIEKKLATVNNKIKTFNFQCNKGAALDSELTLVKQHNYSLAMWIPNPYFAGFHRKKLQFKQSDVIMVSRLDAPVYSDVKRIIDDSLYAETNGLKGKAYFDARWPNPGEKDIKDYAYYDRSIHLAAEKIKKSNLMPVKKDESSDLFQLDQCPDAALYCGWYKLANYVDAFTWQKGAVGYHIASAECTTLKNKRSRVWCKKMLEKGIAATIGPVGEPYVQAFPVPDLFFDLLSKGKLTLVECYFFSTPFISWKMVLIGDPLYNPFITMVK